MSEEWFNWYTHELSSSIEEPPKEDGSKYACPCCGYKTLRERGGYDICQVCFWEDDGQDEMDKDSVRGGPNGSLSLTQARENFKSFFACAERFIYSVREPKPEEL